MIVGLILEKLIYLGICIAVFVVFKRASKDSLKSFFWAFSAGITLFLTTLFAEFTSTNGQNFLKRISGIEPSEASEILFSILTIILPILWFTFFFRTLKKNKCE